MVVPRNPDADHVGHGRILPLVGGVRPYVYDVTYDGGRSRVYADTPAGVLDALIDDYRQLWQTWREASTVLEQVEDRDDTPTEQQVAAAEDAYYFLLSARIQYATAVRCDLQASENKAARASGSWDRLTDEERTQCEESAAGKRPLGVLVEAPWDPDPGQQSATVEFGVWDTEHCKLVINRGDYGLFDLDGTPEPQSTLTQPDPQTGEEIVVVDDPPNLVVIDPTTDWLLLDSLAKAGVLTIITRPVDLPDAFYTEAVEMGRHAMASGEG